MKWNEKYYILYILLYDYKSALETIISNFFSLFIGDTIASIIASNILVLGLSTKSVSVLSPGGWKSIPYHFDVDALSNGRFNGITISSSI